MESWRSVWRKGIAPLLPVRSLEALREGIVKDDPRLIQGATTVPPAGQYLGSWPVEAACVLGFCGWQGEGLETVEDVEGFFVRMCFEIDQVLQEPAACRWFLNWADDAPRDEVRRGLLLEINKAIAERSGA